MSDRPPRAPSVPSFTLEDNGVTFMIVSAAGLAYDHTYSRIQQELDAGRRVNVIPTPTAAEWLDAAEIERLTGWPPRPSQRHPSTPTFDPPGSSVLASPVTLNTLTKWVSGHSDNLALSLLCEATGLGVPTRAEINLGAPYSKHPAVIPALQALDAMGVTIATPPGARRPLPAWRETGPGG